MKTYEVSIKLSGSIHKVLIQARTSDEARKLVLAQYAGAKITSGPWEKR